ncbi:MAG: HlyD family efflux transporter periplasmic adaptor subunit [bacterium]|nr:HlyD family efflux transporter periplasmic adaptor subunit [bacterium]
MDIARPSRKKQILRRRILLGIAGAAVLVLITVGLGSLEPAAYSVERASLYTGTVVRGEFPRLVRGPGNLVPEEIRWIAAQTNGRVDRIVIRPGALVTAESVILELSNPELEQSAHDAELALRAAEAEYTNLRVQLESQLLGQQANQARVNADYEGALLRAEADSELFGEGLIPDIEARLSKLNSDQLTVQHEIEQELLEKMKESIAARLAVSRAGLEQSRALYELRISQLDALRVRAGISGVLQQVPVEEGQQLTPGTNLARVARPEKLKAELRIAETQARDVLIGQLATIDTRNGEVEGRVARIDPAVQQGTVTVDVALPDELPKGARPDLSVDGEIELERLEDVLYVRRPPFGQPNSTVGLYKLSPDGETAVRVPVKLGRGSVSNIEIIEGLEVGDEIILSDSTQWDEHDRIRLN